MKKFLNTCIVFISLVLVCSFILECRTLSKYIKEVIRFTEEGMIHKDSVIQVYVLPTIEYSFIVFFTLCAIAACIFLFVYCNPRLFRRSTWTNLSEEWSQAKSERLARKQEKAEADKQKRLEELQAEIEKLKRE